MSLHLISDGLTYFALGVVSGREFYAWYRRRQAKKRTIKIPIPGDFSSTAVNYMFARARSLRLGQAVEVIWKQGNWVIPEWRIQFERASIVSPGISASDMEQQFEEDPPAKKM